MKKCLACITACAMALSLCFVAGCGDEVSKKEAKDTGKSTTTADKEFDAQATKAAAEEMASLAKKLAKLNEGQQTKQSAKPAFAYKTIDSEELEPLKSNTELQKNLNTFYGFEFGSKKKTEGDLDMEFNVKLEKPFRHCDKVNLFYTDRTLLLKTVQLDGKCPEGFTKEQLKEEAKTIADQFKAKYGVALENSYGGDTWNYEDDDFKIRVWVSDSSGTVQFTVENTYAVRMATGPAKKLAATDGADLLTGTDLSSFFGFKFGTKSNEEYPDKHDEPLAKAFRYFDKADAYYTEKTKLLESVTLEGKAPDSFTQADRKEECEIIARMIGEKYGICFKSEEYVGGWRCKFPKGLQEEGNPEVEISISSDSSCRLSVKNKRAVAKAAGFAQTISKDAGADPI